MTYALVTPARDESPHLRRLAEALQAQTTQPSQWLIVDDESVDETRKVALELAADNSWILSVDSRSHEFTRGSLGSGRRSGRDVIAFTTGLEFIERTDVVIKLDADVSFESDFFGRLLAKFAQDPKLGIASGTCYELTGGEWCPRHVIARHARGATRAYRWACLQDVLPLVPRLGWDSIDELRANARGWRTTSFLDLPFRHHRPLGEREGRHVRAWLAEGETDYFLGYRPLYLIARTIHHLPHDPSAIGLVGGYAHAMLARRPQLVDPEVRARLREEQRLRNVPRFRREARGRRDG